MRSESRLVQATLEKSMSETSSSNRSPARIKANPIHSSDSKGAGGVLQSPHRIPLIESNLVSPRSVLAKGSSSAAPSTQRVPSSNRGSENGIMSGDDYDHDEDPDATQDERPQAGKKDGDTSSRNSNGGE